MLKTNKIKNYKIPHHIGFIMDGNGRWATRRGLPRTVGYKYGTEALKRVVSRCCELGVKVVSVFAFSTENWGRPQNEIDEIFNLVRNLVKEDISFFLDRDIKLSHMGKRDRLPNDILSAVDEAIEKTKHCKKCVLNIAFDYGGRDELVRAFNSLIEQQKTNVTENDVTNALQSAEFLDLDLLVRTSGEQRLSNFMLWQAAYCEIYFTKVFWPDVKNKDVDKAIEFFSGRNRRFGKI